jgi:metal-responsive CopG/Arc/MetJ family transcriptional regulator
LIAKSNSSTAFRLPQGLLATVDIICDKQDLTRSQVFRRSITEYLKSQQVEVLPEPEPKLTWSEAVYRGHR